MTNTNKSDRGESKTQIVKNSKLKSEVSITSTNQNQEIKEAFMKQSLKIANQDIKKDWLKDINESNYSTYILNAFYLLEIYHFLDLVVNAEQDNLFRINSIHSERQKLSNGQLLKTYTPPLSPEERLEYVYFGDKISVEVQKIGKMRKQHLLRLGFLQKNQISMQKTYSSKTGLLLYTNISKIKLEMNIEMQRLMQQSTTMQKSAAMQKSNIIEPKKDVSRNESIVENHMPVLGNMHSQVQKERIVEANANYDIKHDPSVPWLSKTNIFRMKLNMAKTEEKEKFEIWVYFPTLKQSLRQRDYIICQKINMELYGNVFKNVSALLKSSFASSFYSTCISNYKQNVQIRDYRQSPTQSDFSLSLYIDGNSQHQSDNLSRSVQSPLDNKFLRSNTYDDQIKTNEDSKMQRINLIQKPQSPAKTFKEPAMGSSIVLQVKKNSQPPDVLRLESRKGTGDFIVPDLAINESKKQSDTPKVINSKKSSYIFPPKYEDITVDQDEIKLTEFQTPKMQHEHVNQIEKQKPIDIKRSISPNIKSSQTLQFPLIQNKYVSDASSNQSQDLNRITEKSELAASDDSFIDFFPSKSNMEKQLYHRGSSGNSKGLQRGSLMSSSDSGNKTLIKEQQKKLSLKSDIQDNLAQIKHPSNTLGESLMEIRINELISNQQSSASQSTNQNHSANLYETFGDAPQKTQIQVNKYQQHDFKHQISDVEPLDSIGTQVIKPQGKSLLLPTYEQDDYRLIQQMPIVKLNQSHFASHHKDLEEIPVVSSRTHLINQTGIQSRIEDTRAKNSSPHWMNQPHIYEQKGEKGSIQFLAVSPQTSVYVSPNISPILEIKQANSVTLFELQGLSLNDSKITQKYDQGLTPQSELVTTNSHTQLHLNPSSRSNIQSRPSFDPVVQQNVHVSIAEIFANLNPLPTITKIASNKKIPATLIRINSFEQEKNELTLNDLEIEMVFELQNTTKTEVKNTSKKVYTEISQIQHPPPPSISQQNPLLEENYQLYVDLNNPTKSSRNQILETKINSIRQLQDSHRQLLDSHRQPVTTRSPNINRSKSMVLNKNNKQSQKIIQSNKNQPTLDQQLNVIIKTSNCQDIKLLFQNEWWSFDIHFFQSKLDKKNKDISRRGLSPNQPDSLLSKIYNEYHMIPKEIKHKYPYSDYVIKHGKSIQIQPKLHSINCKKMLLINLHLEGSFKFDQKYTNNHQDLLTQIGISLYGQYIKPLDIQLSQQTNLKNNKQIPEKQVQGFNLKYLLQALKLVDEQLMSRDSRHDFTFEQKNSNQIILDYHQTQHEERPLNYKVEDMNKYQYFYEEDEESEINMQFQGHK